METLPFQSGPKGRAGTGDAVHLRCKPEGRMAFRNLAVQSPPFSPSAMAGAANEG
jgi:hypothetical protein